MAGGAGRFEKVGLDAVERAGIVGTQVDFEGSCFGDPVDEAGGGVDGVDAGGVQRLHDVQQRGESAAVAPPASTLPCRSMATRKVRPGGILRP